MPSVVFDAVDLLMERLRRDHLAAVLVAGLLAWMTISSLILALYIRLGMASFGALLLIPPAAILGATAIWGLGALPWPVWPIGVAPTVFIAAVFGPQADSWSAGPGREGETVVLRLTIGIFIFVYAQIHLSTVVSMDEFHKRRTVAGGVSDSRRKRTAARRVTQLKLLVAIIILAMSLVADPTDLNPPTSTSSWPVAFGVSLLFSGLALFVRNRGTAWMAAAFIGVTFALTVASIDASHRTGFLTANLWICLTTCYLFAKAGTRWFWPRSS